MEVARAILQTRTTQNGRADIGANALTTEGSIHTADLMDTKAERLRIAGVGWDVAGPIIKRARFDEARRSERKAGHRIAIDPMDDAIVLRELGRDNQRPAEGDRNDRPDNRMDAVERKALIDLDPAIIGDSDAFVRNAHVETTGDGIYPYASQIPVARRDASQEHALFGIECPHGLTGRPRRGPHQEKSIRAIVKIALTYRVSSR